jgi:hypothetical protein
MSELVELAGLSGPGPRRFGRVGYWTGRLHRARVSRLAGLVSAGVLRPLQGSGDRWAALSGKSCAGVLGRRGAGRW